MNKDELPTIKNIVLNNRKNRTEQIKKRKERSQVKLREGEDWIYVVLKVERETGKQIIWKVVATRELAESYYEDDNDKYRYRYEDWRVTGKSNC